MLAEEREVCPGCGQPIEECRDKDTARTWGVVQETCQACAIMQAVMEDGAKTSARGVYYGVRRNA